MGNHRESARLWTMAFRLGTLSNGRAVLLDDGLMGPGDDAEARWWDLGRLTDGRLADPMDALGDLPTLNRSEEHTSELQSQ